MDGHGLILFTIAVLPLSHTTVAAPQQTVLLDFEDARSSGLAEQDGNPQRAIDGELSSAGKRSLRMSFKRYQVGMPQWPGFSIDLAKMGARRDWRLYSELLIDLQVTSADDVLVKIPLKSPGRGRWVGARVVPPGKWTTLRFPLAQVASGVDLGSVGTLGLVLTRPPHPAVIHLDNVRVRVFGLTEPAAVDLLLTEPSFHAGFFHTKPEGSISVRVMRRTAPEALAGGQFRFSVRRADGREIAARTIAGRELPLGASVSFPKPAMKDGEKVTLRMAAVRDGEALWHRDIEVVQYPRTSQEITLRDDGVTLINGVPFFPLGLYSCPSSEFSYIKAMGFNSVHSYSPVSMDYLRAAEAAGLRALPRLRGEGGKDFHIYHDPDLNAVTPVNYINSLKSSPALLGYYLFDEPNPGQTPREKLKALCDLVRRTDPYHLAAGCNNSYQAAYYRVSDAMMVDSYPVPGPLDQLIHRTREGAAAQAPNYGLWFIPQAFNYETHFAHRLDRPGRYGLRRLPTFDETRTMPWLAIALGAKGLFYYSFQTQGFYHRDAFPWFWRGFGHHVKEVTALLPWLTERERGQPPSSDNPKVLVMARQRGEDLLLVAANSGLKATTATLAVPGLRGRPLHVLSEKRTVEPNGDSFREGFAGLETHLYLTSLPEDLAALPTLDAIRAEVDQLHAKFREANPSTFTYRDGARLSASWGFPDHTKFRRNIWYRMIDSFPGTQWVVGHAYRHPNRKEWRKKDFTSAGRWVEVRVPKAKPIDRVRAILTPGISFDVLVSDEGQWRTVKGETALDDPPRHHRYPSATTTAQFDAIDTDRFRVVFTEPRKDKEVVLELSAWSN